MSEQAEIDKLIPVSNTLTIGDKTIEIKTMKVKQLSQVLKAVRPFIGAFTDKEHPVDIMSLLIANTDDVVSLISILTGESTEWVEELEIDSLVEVFSKLVEVNLDFFTRRVFPSLSQAMGRLNVGVKSALPSGQIPSNS